MTVYPWLPLIVQFLLAILRYGLAALFLFSSINKIRDQRGFYNIVRSYRLLPAFAIKPFSFLLPWVELLLSILLVVGWNTKPVGWITGALYGAFTVALSVNLIRGRKDLDCGCFGAKEKHKITIGLVFRDVGLMLTSCIVAIFGGGIYAFDNLIAGVQLTVASALKDYLLPVALTSTGLILFYRLFIQTLRFMYLSTKEN